MAERKLADVKWDIERCTCHVPGACSDCSHKAEHANFPVCMENLMLEAYELLKKQTPIEPEYFMDGLVKRCRCKKCGKHIVSVGRYRDNYCAKCGQAVKWE